MHNDCEILTVKVQGVFNEERMVRLVRQPNGEYREAEDSGTIATMEYPRERRAATPGAGDADGRPDSLTATLEGRFGEEHRIRLVRQPNGQYDEVLEATDLGQL